MSGSKISLQGSLFKISDFLLGFRSKYFTLIYGAAMELRMVKIVAEFADGLLLMLPTLGYTKLVVQTAQSIAKRRSR